MMIFHEETKYVAGAWSDTWAEVKICSQSRSRLTVIVVRTIQLVDIYNHGGAVGYRLQQQCKLSARTGVRVPLLTKDVFVQKKVSSSFKPRPKHQHGLPYHQPMAVWKYSVKKSAEKIINDQLYDLWLFSLKPIIMDLKRVAIPWLPLVLYKYRDHFTDL